MTEPGKKNGDEKGKHVKVCARPGCGATFYAESSANQYCSWPCKSQVMVQEETPGKERWEFPHGKRGVLPGRH